MTSKDYTAIAKILKEEMDQGSFHVSLNHLIGELCKYMKQDNPRFDHKQFLKACG